METEKRDLYDYPAEARIEEIALEAAQNAEVQDVVRKAEGKKLRAVVDVRNWLFENYPEIKTLPQPVRNDEPNFVGGRMRNPLGTALSNDFIIAKHIVELLLPPSKS